MEVTAVCHLAGENKVGFADAGEARGGNGDQGFYGVLFGGLFIELIMGHWRSHMPSVRLWRSCRKAEKSGNGGPAFFMWEA